MYILSPNQARKDEILKIRLRYFEFNKRLQLRAFLLKATFNDWVSDELIRTKAMRQKYNTRFLECSLKQRLLMRSL